MKASFMRNGSKLVLLAVVVAACLAFVGCAGASQDASSASSASSAESGSSSAASASASSASASASSQASQASDGLVFGDKASSAQAITVRNDTGADITGLSAQAASGEGASVSLMNAGESLPVGAQATVYVPAVAAGVYTLSFMVGDQPRELHNVDTSLLTDIAIMMENDVAYIASTVDGNPVSTLQEEYEIAHPANQAADEENAEEVFYEETETGYYYEEPAAEAPAQQEDSCVSDVILN